MPAKTAYFLPVSGDAGIEMQLDKAAYNSIATSLGLVEMTKKGEPPAGKSIVGSGSQDAYAAGAIRLACVYTKNEKKQTAKVWVSPTKMGSGMMKLLEGKNYRTYPINKVLNVRRRVYV
jgi:hypothetical protein